MILLLKDLFLWSKLLFFPTHKPIKHVEMHCFQ